MENLVYFILGAVFSLWSGYATTQWFYFREQRVRAIQIIAEITATPSVIQFIDNARLLHQSLFPVRIALMSAEHHHAAQEIQEVAEEMTQAFAGLLMKPSPGSAGHSVETRFQMDVWVLMAADTRWVERLQAIRPNRMSLFEPLIFGSR